MAPSQKIHTENRPHACSRERRDLGRLRLSKERGLEWSTYPYQLKENHNSFDAVLWKARVQEYLTIYDVSLSREAK